MAIDFILTAFASWRLSNLLVNEEGPFAIFSKMRYKAGVRKIPVNAGDAVDSITVAKSTIAQGLTCVWCVSVWSAVLLSIPFAPLRWARNILAISAGAIAAHEGIEWLRYRQ